MEHDHSIHDAHPNHWRTGRTGGLFIMGAIGTYFLLTRHYAHVLDALPFLLLLACPLMHIFMHHGHGDHGNHNTVERQSSELQDHPQAKLSKHMARICPEPTSIVATAGIGSSNQPYLLNLRRYK